MAGFDLIIHGGLVVDGSGREPFKADIAICAGKIAHVGPIRRLGDACEIIDARDLLVTPGFIDIHTHYDCQATWSNRQDSVSSHEQRCSDRNDAIEIWCACVALHFRSQGHLYGDRGVRRICHDCAE